MSAVVVVVVSLVTWKSCRWPCIVMYISFFPVDLLISCIIFAGQFFVIFIVSSGIVITRNVVVVDVGDGLLFIVGCVWCCVADM